MVGLSPGHRVQCRVGEAMAREEVGEGAKEGKLRLSSHLLSDIRMNVGGMVIIRIPFSDSCSPPRFATFD